MFGIRTYQKLGSRPVVVPKLDFISPRHYQRMFEIETLSFDRPWTRNDFFLTLKNPSVAGLCMELCDTIVGYAIIERIEPTKPKGGKRGCRRRIEILNLAVAPHICRRGVGRVLIGKVKEFAGDGGTVRAIVRETNLDAQLFFRSMGFRAVKILPRYYNDGQPVYQFVWKGHHR